MRRLQRLVVISGCSGGGKSTLLRALERLGHAVMPEPGRRIVRRELASGGAALPWRDFQAFAREAVDMSLADLEFARQLPAEIVFFDRGLVDAANAFAEPENVPELALRSYDNTVFIVPPWPEIFENDDERRGNFEGAVAEYRQLVRRYEALGYDLCELPKVPVDERVQWVRRTLKMP